MPLANVVSEPLLPPLLAYSWTCAITYFLTILKVQNVLSLTAGGKCVVLVLLGGKRLRCFLPHPLLLWVTTNSYEQCGITGFRDKTGTDIFWNFAVLLKNWNILWIKKHIFWFTILLERPKSDHVLSDHLHFGKGGWLHCVVLLFTSVHTSSWILFCCWCHHLPFLWYNRIVRVERWAWNVFMFLLFWLKNRLLKWSAQQGCGD